jgi:hypothetical protein
MRYNEEFIVTGTPKMCDCGKPAIRTIMGNEGDWYVGMWCGCDASSVKERFLTKEEAETFLFSPGVK